MKTIKLISLIAILNLTGFVFGAEAKITVDKETIAVLNEMNENVNPLDSLNEYKAFTDYPPLPDEEYDKMFPHPCPGCANKFANEKSLVMHIIQSHKKSAEYRELLEEVSLSDSSPNPWGGDEESIFKDGEETKICGSQGMCKLV